MALRVLVVDDHPSFRRFARRLLEAAGYEVVAEAADGASAREVVRRQRPDLVLLDVLLPDTSGFELAEELHVESGGPVVVLTSSRSASEFDGAIKRSSARAFITKRDLTPAAIADLLIGLA